MQALLDYALLTFRTIFFYAILINALLSWIAPPTNRNYPIFRILHNFIEPILIPARKLTGAIPFLRDLPIDFSPVVALLLLDLLIYLLRRLVWILPL